MACVGCGAVKTIRAHLFPKAFCAQIATGWDGIRQPMVHSPTSPTQHAAIIQSGPWDSDILCANCDNILGQYDKYAVEFRDRIFEQHIYKLSGKLPVVIKDSADPKKLLLFALSIIWRFGIIKKDAFGRINIGPYLDRLRPILLNGLPLTSNFDAMLSVAKAKNDGAEHSYRTPVPISNRYLKGYRFYICGLEFLVRLGEQRRTLYGSEPEKELWLRSANEVALKVDRFDNTFFGAELRHHIQTKPRDLLLAMGERPGGKVLPK